MNAIAADYRTVRHIPSRKCYQLILEVPEEDFPNVCKVLGYPKTGENTYVGIALLDKDVIAPVVNKSFTTEQTEGEKLRTRAVMLCKDKHFQEYVSIIAYPAPKLGVPIKKIAFYSKSEDGARQAIIDRCFINSRAELATNVEASVKFKEFLAEFDAWKLSQQYADNLSR